MLHGRHRPEYLGRDDRKRERKGEDASKNTLERLISISRRYSLTSRSFLQKPRRFLSRWRKKALIVGRKILFLQSSSLFDEHFEVRGPTSEQQHKLNFAYISAKDEKQKKHYAEATPLDQDASLENQEYQKLKPGPKSMNNRWMTTFFNDQKRGQNEHRDQT